MKKIIENVIIIILIVIVLLMSIILLSYNEYHVSQFGDKSLLIANNNMLDYKKGSLLIIENVNYEEIKIGDYIFYYDTTGDNVVTVLAKVSEVNHSKDKYKVVLSSEISIDQEYILGTNKSTKEYRYIGSILKIFESKIGNLFLIVIPAFLLFVYELIDLILQYKKDKLGMKNH